MDRLLTQAIKDCHDGKLDNRSDVERLLYHIRYQLRRKMRPGLFKRLFKKRPKPEPEPEPGPDLSNLYVDAQALSRVDWDDPEQILVVNSGIVSEPIRTFLGITVGDACLRANPMLVLPMGSRVAKESLPPGSSLLSLNEPPPKPVRKKKTAKRRTR